jgi:hypothetical protein
MSGNNGCPEKTSASLRQKAARARRLADLLPRDPAAERLQDMARELEAEADRLDGGRARDGCCL